MHVPNVAGSLTLAISWLAVPVAARFRGVQASWPGISICPPLITETGPDPSNWTVYGDVGKALACNYRPRLLDFTVHYPVEGNLIRACGTYQGDSLNISEAKPPSPGVESTTTKNELQLGWIDTEEQVITPQAITALKELQSFLLTKAIFNQSSIFAHYGDTAVGIYVGDKILPAKIATNVVESLIKYLWDNGMPRHLAVQHYKPNLTSDYVLGIVLDNTPGEEALANVQAAVSAWTNATSVDLAHEKSFGKFDIEFKIENSTALLPSNSTARNSTASIQAQGSECNSISAVPGDSCDSLAKRCGISTSSLTQLNSQNNFCSTIVAGQQVCCSRKSTVSRRASECSTEQVKSGDSCTTLAARCGIRGADFLKYNTKENLCSTLREGQYVCCSSGDLPDFTPKPDEDGNCAIYNVIEGDYCSKIAAAHSLEVKDIEEFNKNTWGWSGCERLFDKAVICLSKGDPPMPAPIADTQCGPQKPGTTKPTDMSKISDLNPCPLNACCNVWGKCGTTADFCTNTTLGPPGTAKKGTNGCISNCGTDIVNNDSPPSSFMRIGYFEAFNDDRPCLWMNARELDSTEGFTHIHFAFAKLTADFQVDVSHVERQFNSFKNLKKIKRILAFGGWVDSTAPDKFHILRNAVKPENRQKVADNIANYIKKHDLDGVDLDWEYPGAPDIPDIPPADTTDGVNYLRMLTLLKSNLEGTGKTVSIAAPASYWYLKSYPIQQIGKVIDYIIYMTYDLHGQWDVENEWASPGCPGGNCLRSHVNMTETINSLAMITKAGVPSSKIVVGVTSYGRSFKMAKSGCTGPMCTFLGSPVDSPAKKGICTGTAGYISNAEIERIISTGKNVQTWFDSSGSDIVVYDDTEWVAYMSASTKAKRASRYKGLNFGGTTDWAVDLEKFSASELRGGGEFFEIIDKDPNCKWKTKDGFTCLNEAVKNTSKPAEDRWKGIQTPCAWRDVLKTWDTYVDDKNLNITDEGNKNEFSRQVQDLLDGDEYYYCASIVTSTNSCKGTVSCEETEDAGPAGYFILNSLSAIHQSIESLYAGISDSENSVQNYLSTMVKTFAPDIDNTDEFNLLADLFGIVIGMGTAPIFNSLLRSGVSSKMDDIKDLVVNGASWAATVAKDFQDSKKETPTDLVSGTLGDMSQIWRDSTTRFLAQVFRGDKDSVDWLGEAIAGGRILYPRNPPEYPNLLDSITKAFYAVLIPYAWKVGAQQAPAFIMDSGYDCKAVGPLNNKYITAEIAEKTEYCYKDRLYYILAPAGPPKLCSPVTGPFPSLPQCAESFFTPPIGLDEFKDKNKWKGLTLDDLIIGAINGYTENGETNSGAYIDLTKNKKKNYDHLIDGESFVINARAPGIVQIPVCKPHQARGLWNAIHNMPVKQIQELKDAVPSWPCPKETDY